MMIRNPDVRKHARSSLSEQPCLNSSHARRFGWSRENSLQATLDHAQRCEHQPKGHFKLTLLVDGDKSTLYTSEKYWCAVHQHVVLWAMGVGTVNLYYIYHLGVLASVSSWCLESYLNHPLGSKSLCEASEPRGTHATCQLFYHPDGSIFTSTLL
jgi:hypothetical protein